MNIGILGGTFDPIHNAHIKIACTALSQFNLDKVLIMPTPYPPHKDKNKITSNFHRINMIKMAIRDLNGVEYSDFELSRNEETYTADTLSLLHELEPENHYYFINGSDSVASFMSWYRPDIILKHAQLIAVKRDDESSTNMEEHISQIEEKYQVKVLIMNMKSMDVSSSYIRTHYGKQVENLVPENVYKYICDNNLYQSNQVNLAWSLSKIMEDLQQNMKEKRYIHTLGVADTAKEMAEIFHVNPNKAYLAGILHDCAKNLSDDVLINICEENNLGISKTERVSPYLLHGKVGAFLASTKYGITDEQVLSAIVWHTTGKENMTTLEKIVFAADYIEPGRNQAPNLEELRKIAKSDLDMLVFRILEDTVSYLNNTTNKVIDEHTINAFNYYKELMIEK